MSVILQTFSFPLNNGKEKICLFLKPDIWSKLCLKTHCQLIKWLDWFCLEAMVPRQCKFHQACRKYFAQHSLLFFPQEFQESSSCHGVPNKEILRINYSSTENKRGKIYSWWWQNFWYPIWKWCLDQTPEPFLIFILIVPLLFIWFFLNSLSYFVNSFTSFIPFGPRCIGIRLHLLKWLWIFWTYVNGSPFLLIFLWLFQLRCSLTPKITMGMFACKKHAGVWNLGRWAELTHRDFDKPTTPIKRSRFGRVKPSGWVVRATGVVKSCWMGIPGCSICVKKWIKLQV